MQACWNQRPVGLKIPLVVVLVRALIMGSPLSSSIIISTATSSSSQSQQQQPLTYHNGFQLHAANLDQLLEAAPATTTTATITSNIISNSSTTYRGDEEHQYGRHRMMSCQGGLLTFELSTGFIYKPSSAETLAMMPSTLQLTDCLESCLQNFSCLAINFEMGLCVLLSSSAKQNPNNLYSSQFPVFTIYAEKKCLLQGDPQAAKQRNKCQRAWTFERVAGFEMKSRPRRRLKVASKELCMESCLTEREFECRSANWYRISEECTLSDQDRHSVSQSEAGDQHINSVHFLHLYGPSNLTYPLPTRPASPLSRFTTPPPGLYQNYYLSSASALNQQLDFPDRLLRARTARASPDQSVTPFPVNSSSHTPIKERGLRQLISDMNGESSQQQKLRLAINSHREQQQQQDSMSSLYPADQYAEPAGLLAQAPVDYLENNCVYEPNKLCEFRKIQNRILKTVDSIYQDINSLDECKQKCLSAPYRCYSFDYGDTSDKVCRTSHLDQASLLAVKEPYLEVVGAITYELAACFSVTIACRAKEMVAQVSSSKSFKGRIYAKSRPLSCVNDVQDSLHFELAMRYHDPSCDVRATSNSQQGVFSNDIVIQHHDRIVTTQDVGLSVYCQYDLGNRSITNNVDLAIDRIVDDPSSGSQNSLGMESKTHNNNNNNNIRPGSDIAGPNSPLTITSLATTVVKSPNVTMRITNMNGQPVTSATVGDRLALLFEIKEKTSPFGIFVREIIAMDGKQLLASAAAAAASNKNNNGMAPGKRGYHYESAFNGTTTAGGFSNLLNENTVESLFQANKANSVQFIDSDGCPTDVNIMGPLVKMDPTGHRILAPFDAFKFPSSDMVFFRAVVTSCVAECRPAVCPSLSANQQASTPTTIGFYSSTETAASGQQNLRLTTQFSPETQQPTTASTRFGSGDLGRETIVSSTLSPTGQLLQQQTYPTRLKPPLELGELNRTSVSREPAWSSGDALTTTPSFGDRDRPLDTSVWASQGMTTTGEPRTVTPASIAQTGRPVQIDGALGTTNWPPQNGDQQLNGQQRAQIVKFLELKLKQQLAASTINSNGNGSLPEMAELYANILTNMMLNGLTGAQSLDGQQSQSAGGLFRPRDEPSDDSVTSRSTQIATDTTTPITLADLEALLASTNSSAIDKGDARTTTLRILQQIQQSSSQTTTPLPEQSARSSKSQPVEQQNSAHQVTNRYRSQQLQQPVSSSRIKNPQDEERKRKANLQALADSYLGAYQSLGKRKRKKRSSSLDEEINNYVYLEHPVATPVGENSLHFTRAAVKMYHENRKHLREKRESLDSHYYDMDELVVQAIRIVDRLQFVPEEKESHSSNKSSSHRTSLARSSLIRAAAASAQNESLQQANEEFEENRYWTRSGALSMVIVAASFVFIQIFLVFVCLMEWNQRRLMATSAARRRYQQQILASTGAGTVASAISSSTLSRCSSVSASSTLTGSDTSLGCAQLHQTNLYPESRASDHLFGAHVVSKRPSSHQLVDRGGLVMGNWTASNFTTTTPTLMMTTKACRLPKHL